jgi:hypothetical protein
MHLTDAASCMPAQKLDVGAAVGADASGSK